MTRPGRFEFGAVLGAALGYALALLVRAAPQVSPRLFAIYSNPPDQAEDPAAAKTS